MEDCCAKETSQNKTENEGGKKMDLKKALPWIAIGILALVVIYVFFLRTPSGAASSAGQVVSQGFQQVGGC